MGDSSLFSRDSLCLRSLIFRLDLEYIHLKSASSANPRLAIECVRQSVSDA